MKKALITGITGQDGSYVRLKQVLVEMFISLSVEKTRIKL